MKPTVYLIVGQFRGQKPEIIDRTEEKSKADGLLEDYRMEFGPDWRISIETVEER